MKKIKQLFQFLYQLLKIGVLKISFFSVRFLTLTRYWGWMKLCEQILNTQSFLSRHLSLSWFVSKSREHSNQLSNSYQLLLIQTQCAISQKKNLSSTIFSQFTNVFRIAKFYFTENWKKNRYVGRCRIKVLKSKTLHGFLKRKLNMSALVFEEMF